jgi:putative transposase
MIESLNTTLRKIIRNRTIFLNDKAIFRSMYLSLKNISKKGIMLVHNWSVATNQFAIMFEGRIPMGDSRGTHLKNF